MHSYQDGVWFKKVDYFGNGTFVLDEEAVSALKMQPCVTSVHVLVEVLSCCPVAGAEGLLSKGHRGY